MTIMSSGIESGLIFRLGGSRSCCLLLIIATLHALFILIALPIRFLLGLSKNYAIAIIVTNDSEVISKKISIFDFKFKDYSS